ncbi:MAG: response regulator [Motiliproteus sp.]
MRILIVDDSRAMQTIVRRGLEKAGYQNLVTRIASDGNEALDIIRVWEPNLVLSDWHMPGMNGMELLSALNREMLSINVGFVTTETSSNCINQAMTDGAKFFVHKPFDFDDLYEAIVPFIPQHKADNNGQALQQEQQPKKDATNILLPSASAFSKVINGFSDAEIFVEPIDPVPLYQENFPYLLGLFSDHSEQVVRAVCVLDIHSASIISGALLNRKSEGVRQSIASKVLSKEMVGACKRVYGLTSAMMRNNATGKDLHLLGTNVVTQPFAKLDMLFNKPASQRVDFEIGVSGYGQGNVTIVAS